MKMLLTVLILASTFQVSANESIDLKMINNCKKIQKSGETYIGSESGDKIVEIVVIRCGGNPSDSNPYCQQQQQQQNHSQEQRRPQRDQSYHARPLAQVIYNKIISREYIIQHGEVIRVGETVYGCGEVN